MLVICNTIFTYIYYITNNVVFKHTHIMYAFDPNHVNTLISINQYLTVLKSCALLIVNMTGGFAQRKLINKPHLSNCTSSISNIKWI